MNAQTIMTVRRNLKGKTISFQTKRTRCWSEESNNKVKYVLRFGFEPKRVIVKNSFLCRDISVDFFSCNGGWNLNRLTEVTHISIQRAIAPRVCACILIHNGVDDFLSLAMRYATRIRIRKDCVEPNESLHGRIVELVAREFLIDKCQFTHNNGQLVTFPFERIDQIDEAI